MQAIPGVRLDRVLSAVPSTFVAAIICVVLLESLGMGQEASQPAATTPRPLITRSVDDLQLTRLRGNTHPLARPEFDLGTAPATLPMDRMLLVLKRSPEQETALTRLLDDQQDKASPNYHKWLTPEQFGQQFGPTDTDIQTITAWLQSHGFAVVPSKGRTVLEFSGSASQVQEAFHTSIHRYIVNGEQHWANASDPLASGKRQRPRLLFLLLALPMLLILPGCGGGSSGSRRPPPNLGTPTGVTYVMVTATSGSTVSQTGFTLVVQ